MTASDPIVIVPYDPDWPRQFREVGERVRSALGAVALRIDHVGSTAIPGLAAKPVIDIQIAVATLEPVDPFRLPLESLGYIFRADNPERTKRYFREPPGTRRTHLHIRRLGSWHEQFPLLFRDYLRTHPAAAERYAARKRALARRYRDDRLAYVAAKRPLIWTIMDEADEWSQAIGWEPGPSDA